jgi:flagellar biosynthesis protein
MKRAAVLRYDVEKDRTPVLVAKGAGLIAERIIEIAEKYNIPIHYDPGLCELLSKLEIDTEIPPSLYEAVASLITFIWGIETTYRKTEKAKREL